MALLLSLAFFASPSFAAPAAPDAQMVSEPQDQCAAAAQSGGSYCADWGADYQTKLDRIFQDLMAATGYNSFFKSLFRGDATLVYHPDQSLIDGSPAVARAPDIGPNSPDHPVIDVGSSILDIAKTPDEVAFILGHEAGHLILEHSKKKKEWMTEKYSDWRKAHPELDGYDPDVRRSKFMKEFKPKMDALQRCIEDEANDAGLYWMSKAGYQASAAPLALNDAEDWAKAIGAVIDTSEHGSAAESSETMQEHASSSAKKSECFEQKQ